MSAGRTHRTSPRPAAPPAQHEEVQIKQSDGVRALERKEVASAQQKPEMSQDPIGPGPPPACTSHIRDAQCSQTALLLLSSRPAACSKECNCPICRPTTVNDGVRAWASFGGTWHSAYAT